MICPYGYTHIKLSLIILKGDNFSSNLSICKFQVLTCQEEAPGYEYESNRCRN